jgi:hypothetical protein
MPEDPACFGEVEATPSERSVNQMTRRFVNTKPSTSPPQGILLLVVRKAFGNTTIAWHLCINFIMHVMLTVQTHEDCNRLVRRT